MHLLVRAVVVVVLTLGLSARSHGQGRTDVVTLANGDRITGEILRLERGRLEFKTNDAGTLYLEWDKLVSLVALRVVEVVTADGRRFLGTLGRTGDRALSVVGPGGTASLDMIDVTLITPIGRNFWRKLDGSLDVGFSYTRSSGVAQFNFNSDTYYRKPASQARLTTSLTVTETDDDSEGDDRGDIGISYLRYPWRRWFWVGVGSFETNESLGLVLRSQVGLAAGPRLVSSNRAEMAMGGGLVFNDERGVDVESARNVEALLVWRASYYTYDRPKTNLDFSVEYYPSLSDPGRQRLQVDAAVKREIWKDFYVSLTVYNTYDSRPPNPTADRNDVGVVASIGWTY